MKFFAVAALFAAAAVAMPHEGSSSTDVNQTQNQCGQAQLSCCQEADPSATVSKKEEGDLLNLLGEGLLNDGGVIGKYHGCASLVNLNSLVEGQCNNHVACCNDVSSENNGLVNVAIPCLPLNLL